MWGHFGFDGIKEFGLFQSTLVAAKPCMRLASQRELGTTRAIALARVIEPCGSAMVFWLEEMDLSRNVAYFHWCGDPGMAGWASSGNGPGA